MQSSATPHDGHTGNIETLLGLAPTAGKSVAAVTEMEANWAKYICILVYGYMEWAIREILVQHVQSNASPNVVRHVERTWPRSRNMKSDVIVGILNGFDKQWGDSMSDWFAEDGARKQQINEIVSWRNDISHGNTANTGNVTMRSVKNKFELVQELVHKVQETVHADS